MFIDYTIIELNSGKGGSGCISFRREKYIPKGGPDGGNGGNGGNIYALSDKNIHTLQDVRYNRIYNAQNGVQGSSNSKTGRDGDDIIIKVPIGTIIKNTKMPISINLKIFGIMETISEYQKMEAWRFTAGVMLHLILEA